MSHGEIVPPRDALPQRPQDLAQALLHAQAAGLFEELGESELEDLRRGELPKPWALLLMGMGVRSQDGGPLKWRTLREMGYTAEELSRRTIRFVARLRPGEGRASYLDRLDHFLSPDLIETIHFHECNEPNPE